MQPGDVTLVHAAADGAGLLLTQLVKARGGTVIGPVSRPEKVVIATAAGADHVVVSTGGTFVEPVRKLTGGERVHAVFDGAGGPTFSASLEVLRTHRMMVLHGPLIGDVPTIAMNGIPRSTRLTHGTLPDRTRTHEELAAYAAGLPVLVERGGAGRPDRRPLPAGRGGESPRRHRVAYGHRETAADPVTGGRWYSPASGHRHRDGPEGSQRSPDRFRPRYT